MRDLPSIDATLRTFDTSALAVVNAAPPTPKANRRHNRRVDARRFVTLAQHGAAVEHLRPLPDPGESLHGAMSGSYSGWSLVTAITELLAVPVDELLVSTLGFNRDNLNSLVALLDSGQVRRVVLNVSDYFRHSDREIFGDIRRELVARGQRVAVTRCHAKVLLFDAGDRHIVCEMSANLRSSANYEQFTIADDADLLAFHRGWILGLIEETERCETD